MDLIQNLDLALDWTSSVVNGTKSHDYDRSTPCREWDVRTLANHLVGGAWMFAGALNGDPLPRGDAGDLVGDDPGAAYDAATAALRAAATTDGVLERPTQLPIGTMPGQVTLNLALVDTLTHGWDLATATGQTADIPANLATTALTFAEQAIDENMRGPGAPFAKAAPAPADATTGERLVAFLGRDPRP